MINMTLTLANKDGSASTTAVKHFMAFVRTATAVSHNTLRIYKGKIKIILGVCQNNQTINLHRDINPTNV